MDYEAKQRQLFESPNPGQTATATVAAATAGGLNPPSQPHTRQPTETYLKLKRHGSSSTGSDPKTQ